LSQKLNTKRVGGVAKVGEHLPSKHETLSSNTSAAKKKKEEEEEEKQPGIKIKYQKNI
jgi:hypothetical protein